ncbi:SDR family NAD(P)-dependent oxidoreductase [Pseudonocardia halophobica]|uniref:SDR family NAD(P)-dependent oxidoreductase n=1 Tax=Pseudonocardia halophobica TaxID=29401 RepID=UPI003D8B43AA
MTGGTRGIGRAIVEGAVGRGARVSFLGRDAAAVDETEKLLTEAGGQVAGVAADVVDEVAVRAAVAAVAERLGPVDVLVNNAGLNTSQGPLHEADLGEWWRDVSVNLLGSAVCAAAVLPSMIERRGGRIISMVSGTAGRATPHNSAYASAKAAVVRLSDSLAGEVAEHGIAVFALRPGTIATDMVARFAASPATRKYLGEQAAAMRPGTPEKAVAATLFLAEGRGDALAGLWIDADEDLEDLVARAPQLHAADLYQLRRRRA